MRCQYCHRRIGLIRRVCATCNKVVAVVQRCAGRVGWTELVDAFANEGLTRAQVDLVLGAEVKGAPALRDHLTSEMANVLMRGLGMPGRQTPTDVQRVRRSALNREDARSWSSCDLDTAGVIQSGEDADGR